MAVATDLTSASLQLSCRPPVNDGSCGWSQPAEVHHVFLQQRGMKQRRGCQAAHPLTEEDERTRGLVAGHCVLWPWALGAGWCRSGCAALPWPRSLLADIAWRAAGRLIARTSRVAAASRARSGWPRSDPGGRPGGDRARAGSASSWGLEKVAIEGGGKTAAVALPGLRRRRAGFVAVRRCVWLAATGGHGSPRLGRSRSHEPLVASLTCIRGANTTKYGWLGCI